MGIGDMRKKPFIWLTLAQASILDSIRRKDLYVSLILALILISAGATVGKFGVYGLETFLKDVTLTVINLLSTLLAVLFAGRQMPEEMERRTLYPLLARPIGRGDVLIGKFLGAYALSLVSLVLFSLIGWLALTMYGLPMGMIFLQHLLLRAMALAVACALSLSLSLVLPASAALTVSLVIIIGSALWEPALLLLGEGILGRGLHLAQTMSYFLLPHLELFDLSKLVSANWKPLAPGVLWELALYAGVFTVALLLMGASRFERRTL